jgi:hypothetical protein
MHKLQVKTLTSFTQLKNYINLLFVAHLASFRIVKSRILYKQQFSPANFAQ